MRLLEVIVCDEHEAALAVSGGAGRLELVAARCDGGVTPARDVIDRVLRAVAVPVHVVVRPHAQGFFYGAAECAAILEAAAAFARLGVHGLVFGALDEHNDLDAALLSEFGAAAHPLPVTFHRAFDAARDPRRVYDRLADFSFVRRVLTSGGAADAWAGRALLAELIATGRQPRILPGAGIHAGNLRALVEATGAREVHVGEGARTEGRVDPKRVEALVRLLRSGVEPGPKHPTIKPCA